MPKDMSLLKCLNCGIYAAGQALQHRDDCPGSVIVEVITQTVAVCCLHCGATVGTEPGECSVCHFVAFAPVYKEPTLSHMETLIYQLLNALAKIQDGHRTDRPMPGDLDDDQV